MYFDDSSDSCTKCHPNCETCQGGGSGDCLTCAQSMYLSYDSLCVEKCPSDSYVNGTSCFRCHKSCLTCTGPLATNCLSCRDSQFLTTSKTCSDQCDPKEVANHTKICQKCHESCGSCSSPAPDACITCADPKISTLTAAGKCIDCLRSPELDSEACWFSVPISLAKASTKALSLKASASVRLTFQDESKFSSKIPE